MASLSGLFTAYRVLGLRNSVARAWNQDKARWVFWIVAGPIVPMIETAFIGILYLVISPEKRTNFQSLISEYGITPDFVSGFSPDTFVVLLLCAAAVLLTIQMVLRYSVQMNGQLLRYRMETDDATRLTSGYLNTPPQSAYRIGKNRVVSSIMQDSGAIGTLVKQSLDALIAGWSICVYLVAALWISPIIVVVSLSIYGIPLWLSRRVFRRMQAVGERRVSAQENSLSFFSDIFQGFERSKLDGLEDHLVDKAGGVIVRNFDWRTEKRRLETKFTTFMDSLSLIGLLITLYVGTALLDIELAALLALFVVFNRIKSATSLISMNFLNMRDIIPNMERMLRLQREFESARTANPADRAVEDLPVQTLKMENLSFAYEPDGEPVLKNINIEINAGDRILITGPSGDGKSTFLRVLCGLLPPTEGTVICDGRVVDDRSFYSLREKLSCVSPDVYLFEDTLRNNLTMNTAGGTGELEAAIRHAGLERVVQNLPQGLDTPIGPNAKLLSLGQRQRLILARLYLRHPQLILLDEATANLNPELEIDVIERLQSFVSSETTIVMVSHKSPPNFRFNRQFSIIDGSLVEQSDSRPAAVASGE
jgi:ABC-type bacteriocin/lantibiotic exporter with double-glycine peptidase domain